MKKLIAIFFALLAIAAPAAPLKLVLLGASNATGQGASDYAHSFAGLYDAWLKTFNPSNALVNLAQGSYATANILPGADGVHDIVGAVNQQPDAIIISITGNDYGGVPSSTIRTNFTTVYNYAHAHNVPIWISTPFPDVQGAGRLDDIQADAAWMTNAFPVHSFDIWPKFRLPGTNYIDPQYLVDSAHINDAGHRLYFQILTNAGIYESLTLTNPPAPVTGKYLFFRISSTRPVLFQDSTNLVDWQDIAETDSVSVLGTGTRFFRGVLRHAAVTLECAPLEPGIEGVRIYNGPAPADYREVCTFPATNVFHVASCTVYPTNYFAASTFKAGEESDFSPPASFQFRATLAVNP